MGKIDSYRGSNKKIRKVFRKILSVKMYVAKFILQVQISPMMLIDTLQLTEWKNHCSIDYRWTLKAK